MKRFLRNIQLRIASYRYAIWLNYSKEGQQLKKRHQELDDMALKWLFEDEHGNTDSKD